MPFKSKSQVRKFGSLVGQGKMSQEEFDKWAHHTKNIKGLPERIGKKKIVKKKKKVIKRK